MKKVTREDVQAAVQQASPYYLSSFGCVPGAGFGAAYLHLISTLVTCLDFGFGYRLVRLSNPSGFAIQLGYEDYFEPFCETARGALLQRLNRSPFPFSAKAPFLRRLATAYLDTTIRPRARYRYAFEKVNSNTEKVMPKVDLGLDWPEKRQSVMHALWAYNERTRDEVEAIKARISVPSRYFSMCIRRGDKSMEFPYVTIERYRSALEDAQVQQTPKTLFVTTDDFRLLPKVAEVFSDFDVVTLTEPKTNGYIHSEFKSLPPSERRYQTVRFFAQLEYLRNAEWVVMSNTTNVSHIASVFRAGEKILWVD